MRFAVKPVEPQDRPRAEKPQAGHKNKGGDHLAHGALTKPEPNALAQALHWLEWDENTVAQK